MMKTFDRKTLRGRRSNRPCTAGELRLHATPCPADHMTHMPLRPATAGLAGGITAATATAGAVPVVNGVAAGEALPERPDRRSNPSERDGDTVALLPAYRQISAITAAQGQRNPGMR